jgi:hypothetical protein
MHRLLSFTSCLLAALAVFGIGAAGTAQSGGATSFDLAKLHADGKLRGVNREATALKADRPGVHLSEAMGPGVVWIEGSDFGQGTIELDVRGKDVLQRSFLGVAFHRKDDTTYEAVYLRPFNFRAEDQTRKDHAVQYVSMPEYDWPRLRKEFPEEFENPVDQSIAPTDWVPLRVVVAGDKVQIYVGKVSAPTLEVRKLGTLDRGAVGLFAGSGSDGDYANVRVTPAK